MLRNWKISSKLALGFGLVVLIFLGSLILALTNLSATNQTLKQIEASVLHNTGTIADIRLNMLTMQRTLYRAVTSPQKENVGSLIEQSMMDMDMADEAIASLKKDYKGSTKEFAAIDELMAQSSAYHMDIVSMIESNETMDHNKALDLLQNTYGPLFDQISDHLLTVSNQISDVAHQEVLDGQKNASNAIVLIVILVVGGIALSFAIGLAITHSITKPAKELLKAAGNLKNGLLNSEINYIAKDEMGMVADEFRETFATLNRYITDISVTMKKMAQGNFDTQLSQSFSGDFREIETSMTTFICNISDTLSQINNAADQVSSGSGQVADASQALAQGSTEQAGSIEILSARINEIAGQVGSNAQNSVHAKKMTGDVTTAILKSNEQMQNLMAAMEDINSNSKEIGKIVKTIEDIAFQTNILALNAAVEAARAGTAGKGFSVVADEVRNLAGKSAEATKNTTMLIESSASSVAVGVRLAQETATELLRVVESVKTATTAVSEIANASGEQSGALSQVSEGIGQISSVVQSNSATSEESAAASEELQSQANLMRELVGKFQLKHISENSLTSPYNLHEQNIE